MTFHRLFLMAAFAALCVAQPPAGSKCDTPAHRAFDFWVGEWEVFTPAGALAGTNRIEGLLGGCALFENWKSAKFGEGKSWNYLNSRTGQWKQFWMDGSGGAQEYVGKPFDKGMQFREEYDLPDGARYIRRMTFTRLENGDVEQLIDQSKDGGKTQTVLFKGIYRRKKQ